jgi:hypothetical protein
MDSPLKLDIMASYFLIFASAICAGMGASSAWIGGSVFFSLIALYKPAQ